MHPPGGSAGPGLGPAVPDVSATSPPPPLPPRHHTLKRGTRAFAKAGVREEKPTSCKKNHVFSMKSSTAIPESVAHTPSAPGSSSSLSPPHTHPGASIRNPPGMPPALTSHPRVPPSRPPREQRDQEGEGPRADTSRLSSEVGNDPRRAKPS